jgi:chromosome partitioning protein
MIITVASYKGGVGKTTTAVHLAGYFQQKAPTLLVDGDRNRSASNWARRGDLPFKVVGVHQSPRYTDFEHKVIDTQARPEKDDLKDLTEVCDLLIIPAIPEVQALETAMEMVEEFRKLEFSRYRILLTAVPPRPSKDGDEARALLAEMGVPIFSAEVRLLRAPYQKASAEGVLVHETKDRRGGIAWRDYVAVGQEIMK